MTQGEVRVLKAGTCSVAEAAYRLGIGVMTAYELIKRGAQPFGTPEEPGPVPVHMIGGTRKIFVAELDAYLAGNTAASAGA